MNVQDLTRLSSRNQAEHQRNADIPSDAEFARESRGNAAESQFSRINEAIPGDASRDNAARGEKSRINAGFQREPNGKRAPLDEKIFATAKFNFGLAVGSDAELPKLAYLFVGKYMNADHGGDAFAAISKYCADLGLSSKSDRAVRVALEALIDQGHLRSRTPYRRSYRQDDPLFDPPEVFSG